MFDLLIICVSLTYTYLIITKKPHKMKTVTEISNSNEQNKSALYLAVANELAGKAVAMIDEDSFFQKKLKDEVVSAFRKCESADCEYTSYSNAHACEAWFSKLDGIINGGLKIQDVM